MAVSAVAAPATPRRVTVLGSTGSIGCNTLDLITANPNAFAVEALTARANVELLAAQAREVRPKLAVIADENAYSDLKKLLNGSGIRVAAGRDGLLEAGNLPSDWVMAGIVGAAGLEPTMAAVKRGAVVALANKECLVCAGDLMIREVQQNRATLLPVDSEHNAIFQVFDFDRPERVERIILTASGGPFRKLDHAAMRTVTPAQAVAHPNWDMGAKISVDSATMMNKGLEMIEALHLFPVTPEQIQVLIHPQSVVHSLVAYCDGSVLAQLGTPDMRTPIAYTMAWPDRIDAPVQRLDLADIAQLTFERPDETLFPALRLAREALTVGGSAPPVLNASNEIAVHAFLDGQIGFLDIVAIVEQALAELGDRPIVSLDDVYEIDAETRRVAKGLISRV